MLPEGSPVRRKGPDGEIMNGIINLIKPPGMSSGGLVSAVKHLTGERVGHAGTLDPEAAGVLPILVGRATRLLDYLPGDEKEYIAEAAFTGATDTQDAQGRLVRPGTGRPSLREMEAVLPSFTGEILQRPPAYSALKKNGVPLYRLARQGVEVVPEARKVRIGALCVIGETADGFLLRVNCSGGTYIRTLCHDLGVSLGRPAHMRFLLRTRSCGLDIGDSVMLEELAAEGTGRFLLPMDLPLGRFERLDVLPAFHKQARNGVALPDNAFERQIGTGMYRIYEAGLFLGMGEKHGDRTSFRVIVRDHNDP